jgi:divalent metal cation (Fe/Co/Zn/Cd) transporter
LNLSFLDPLGGVVLSLYVIFNWSHTANEHICNLAGQAATADQRNILLYLTMRFAKTIKHIQGLQAYHVGDKLNVEVDIVLDERTSLRDSHDLGESLQYVLESVPEGGSPLPSPRILLHFANVVLVDRAFVHMDYLPYNLPTHMQQHG